MLFVFSSLYYDLSFPKDPVISKLGKAQVWGSLFSKFFYFFFFDSIYGEPKEENVEVSDYYLFETY